MNTHYSFPIVAASSSSEAAAVDALYAMGHSKYSLGCFADAAAIFRIMIQAVPEDERGWLALGECHEQVGHSQIALELYGAGTVAVMHAARCEIARARLLRELGNPSDVEEAWEAAHEAAVALDDHELCALIEQERNFSS